MGVNENLSRVQPFYFKSYDRVIGIARNVNDLQGELTRLAEENPDALEYHIKEGQIGRWLDYANEKELAEQLKDVKSIEQARIIVNQHIENSKLIPSTRDPMAVTHDKHHKRVH